MSRGSFSPPLEGWREATGWADKAKIAYPTAPRYPSEEDEESLRLCLIKFGSHSTIAVP
ncbi:MAG: hypothetical protein K6F85_05920 [Bacteroidales bacterium]|nr:hypothetical protein [Bacteroidales bacterium]